MQIRTYVHMTHKGNIKNVNLLTGEVELSVVTEEMKRRKVYGREQGRKTSDLWG